MICYQWHYTSTIFQKATIWIIRSRLPIINWNKNNVNDTQKPIEETNSAQTKNDCPRKHQPLQMLHMKTIAFKTCNQIIHYIFFRVAINHKFIKLYSFWLRWLTTWTIANIPGIDLRYGLFISIFPPGTRKKHIFAF